MLLFDFLVLGLMAGWFDSKTPSDRYPMKNSNNWWSMSPQLRRHAASGRTESFRIGGRFISLLVLAILAALLLSYYVIPKRPVKKHGEFAPRDAYLAGSKHPYYGSENPWDRRFFTGNLGQYRRRGERQMLDIVEGRPAEASAYCRELLARDPSDLESLFNLAAAEANLGNTEAAMIAMRKSVERGLPFERFLAGPRDVLRPLVASEAFRKYLSQHPVQLLHGPLVGSVTDRAARIWVRTLDEVPVRALVGTEKGATNPIRSSIQTTKAGDDYTAIIEIAGLQPATTYYYDLLVDGRPTFGSDQPSFRTYPSPDARVRFQVGFGGGAGYNPQAERMWDVIGKYGPEALLLMGDNVYITLPGMPNGVHNYAYYQRQSRPEFRRLVSSTPIYAIWDDHDAAMDDVWLGPYKDKPAWKMPQLDLFRRQWNNPAYGTPEWPGCWFNFSIGPVEFFMLDCRFYRTNPYMKHPTMLGPVQKAWLKDKLRQSKAQFKVLASSVTWTFLSKGDAKDTWNGFREERKEIFDLLAENKINGVILLAADRHRSEAWRDDRPNGYPLYEFESSRLTNQHVHNLVPGTLFGYNNKQSFGLLTFDTTLPDPSVTYQIVSIDNEVVGSLTIKLSEISHRSADVLLNSE